MSATTARRGMTAATARTVEATIIGLCIVSLALIFQPFSKWLSGLGMALVVVGGLAFNLVPLCQPGRPGHDLVRAAIIVVLIFVVVAALAIGSAYLYGEYLRVSRG